MNHLRSIGLAATLLGLASCQLPGEGPSLLASRPVIDSGPSAQRLGPDGYPLVGAFPKAAAPQLDDQGVAADRAALKAAAAQQNATASQSAAEYNGTIADLRKIRDRQRADVDAALKGAIDPETADGQ